MSRIVVTGANGFLGRAVCRALVDAGHEVVSLVRRPAACGTGVREWVLAAPNFEGIERAWPSGLQADCVVHLAARAHVTRETSDDPLAVFRATNVDGALRVANSAHENGVRRFVFASSIKAIAETDPGRPLRENDPAVPQDAYGRSKLEAELVLRRFGERSGLDVILVRPPLVYGPGVRANFFSLMHSIAKGIPLPLGAIDARRSLVYVDSLADSIVCCATDARAANDCFHVADDEYPTVAELASAIGRHLQKPARLVAVPPAWLRFAGRVSGRLPQVERLTGNLRVDNSHIRATLDWRPSRSLDDGLAETARWYRTLVR